MCYHSRSMVAVGRIEELKTEGLDAVAAAGTTAELESLRVRYLGRSAELTEIKKGIRDLAPEDRKTVGASSNIATKEIEAALAERLKALAAAEREEKLHSAAVHVTLPGTA